MLLEPAFLRQLDYLNLLIQKTQNSSFTGIRQSKFFGHGLEFNDFRHYQPGDDYRYIDWNIYCRLGQLFTKQFVEEKDTSIYLLIDKSTSMSYGNPAKFEYAVKLMAALGYIGLSQLDRVGCAFFANSLENEILPKKGRSTVLPLFSFLENTVPSGETNLSHVLTRFIKKHKKPGLAVICTDLLDESDYKYGLMEMKKNNWEVLLIHVLSDEELNPSLENQVELFDSETKQKLTIEINQSTLEAYNHRLQDFLESIANFCHQYNIYYTLAPTSISLPQYFRVLHREGVLR